MPSATPTKASTGPTSLRPPLSTPGRLPILRPRHRDAQTLATPGTSSRRLSCAWSPSSASSQLSLRASAPASPLPVVPRSVSVVDGRTAYSGHGPAGNAKRVGAEAGAQTGGQEAVGMAKSQTRRHMRICNWCWQTASATLISSGLIRASSSCYSEDDCAWRTQTSCESHLPPRGCGLLRLRMCCRRVRPDL